MQVSQFFALALNIARYVLSAYTTRLYSYNIIYRQKRIQACIKMELILRILIILYLLHCHGYGRYTLSRYTSIPDMWRPLSCNTCGAIYGTNLTNVQCTNQRHISATLDHTVSSVSVLVLSKSPKVYCEKIRLNHKQLYPTAIQKYQTNQYNIVFLCMCISHYIIKSCIMLMCSH